MGVLDAVLETININDIDLGERARKKYTNIDELINSIKKNGLIQPIAVLDKSKVSNWSGINLKNLKEDKKFLLLAGGRRVQAHREGEIANTISARIYSEPLTSDEIKEIELVENIHREELTWHERVELEEQIHDLQIKIKGKKVSGSKEEGHTIEETGQLLGKSKSSISRDLHLAKALKKIPQLKSVKTKADANKMLRKLGQTYESKTHATEITKKFDSTPIGKQRRKLAESYIVKDCREGLKDIPDNSISFVEVDPPYAIDILNSKRGGKHTKMSYNEVSVDTYSNLMQTVFSECYRIMKPDSWIVSWFAPDPWFSPTQEWMKDAGFKVRALPCIWVKGQGQTNQPHRYLASSYEMFFYGAKGNPIIYKPGRPNTFIYKLVSPSKKIHITERPIEMMQTIVETFTGGKGRGVVPFLGSGNTLLAMANLGMEGLGYDLSEDHKNDFIIRVESSRPGKYKSYEEKS